MLGIDISGFRCDSTSDFGERNYSSVHWAFYGVPQTQLANRLYATPYYFLDTTLVDDITLLHLGTVANTRCGIYRAGNPGDTISGVYPTSLLVDGGQVTVSNVFGVYFNWTVNVTIPANTLVWLATITDTNNDCVNVPGLNNAGIHILGNNYGPASGGSLHPIGISLPQLYGALPNPFPNALGASYETNPIEVGISMKTITPVAS